ncbi:hypothetical protein [Streptomyces sp. NPDC001985]|uniref:hypothetical protein n=1 Tax=Streptomyces sp. NPDC001985 TaxID=3154406 RepID=UPI00331E7FF4
MASIRTARVLAAVAALPLTVALFSGAAAADNGVLFADDGSSTTVGALIGGVAGDNYGTSTTSQLLTSPGSTGQSSVAGVSGSAFTFVDQDNVSINFTPLWW